VKNKLSAGILFWTAPSGADTVAMLPELVEPDDASSLRFTGLYNDIILS
jgi:hypothetical protein